MAKRKFRKGAGVRIAMTFLLTLLIGYVLSGLFTLLKLKGELNNRLLDVSGTLDYVLNDADNQTKLLILLLMGVFFFWFISKMNLIEKTYEDAHDYGVHGSARFTLPHEVMNGKQLAKRNKYHKTNPTKTFESLENGLIVGKVPDKKQVLIIPRETSIDNRNVYVVGSSGSGKGQSYVLPNLLNNREESIIVTDPKGELFHETAQIKREQGYQVYQVDFINFNEDRYNLLDYVLDDQDAQSVSLTIAKNSTKDGKEDFFMERAQKMLAGLIVYCKTEKQNASMKDVIATFNEKVAPDEDEFRDWVEDELGQDHPAYQILKGLTTLGGNTRASVTSSFASQVSIFTLNKISKMTSTSDFNFRAFQEQKSILYVKLPMDDNPFMALTSVFFDQLISQFYKMADENRGKLKIPTIFLLDEFANIGKIEKYGRVLATCRGLGLSMNTIVQDNGQIEAMYGKEMARSILSNHDTLLYLRSKDMETIKYFSQLAGETTAKVQTGSTSQSGGFMSGKSSASSSQSEQYVKKPLIPEGDLSNISKDTSYLFVSGMFPMKLEKAWQSEVFGNYLEQFHHAHQVEEVERVVDTQIAATEEEEPLVASPPSISGGTTTRVIEEEWNQSEHLDLDFDESELEQNESLTEEEDALEKEDIQKRLKEKEVTIQNFF
ncbi:VirD4-like conjugal transfer protein, CD1115 family [Paenisporosarcina sp. NPDC076898]|uniref:VirD4-like conjugal transfer protein, CD1115 family n=1 Tax=unclassified Paenisporosarcina TaxID=2642018 RepID=UPI003D012A59